MKAVLAVMLASSVAHAGPARVGKFWLDREPVTNAEFLAFVRAEPEWRRDRADPQYAAGEYLASWAAPGSLGRVSPRAPVVRVSWFAARAYCAWRGGRLPREAEWELAAETDSPAAQREILDWYSRPTPALLPDVGGPPNQWGVRDLHGLVWEWIEDYTATLPGTQTCGGEAAAAKDPSAYAAFMRAAFRGSLDGRDAISSLGFRCAYDAADHRPARVTAPLELAVIAADRGHPTLVSMFYGSCTASCPLLIGTIERALDALPASERDDVRVVLVSFDPARDTPARLRELAAEHRLDARWTLSAASDSDARALAAVLGFRYRALADGQFSHTAAIVALDRDGRIAARMDGLRDTSELAAALARLGAR